MNIYACACFYGILVCFVNVAVGSEGIIGGKKATEYQFPYQVTLVEHGGDTCGGGIIGTQFILTAAHCVTRANGKFSNDRISILAGSNDLHKTDAPAVIVHVKKVYVPKGYERESSNRHDIAVLKLEHPLELSTRIKKLELPWRQDEDFTGQEARIAGFGWNWVKMENGIESGGNNYSHLRYAETTVINNSECQLGHNDLKISENEICAQVEQHQDEHRGVCTGDSGSPLVYDRRTVIGILRSSPKGCNETKSAAIYTRVSYYMLFIKDAMNDKPNRDTRTHILW